MKISKIILIIIVILILFRKKKAVNPTVINYNTNRLEPLALTDLERKVLDLQSQNAALQIMEVDQLSDLTFPLRKGFIKVRLDTNFSTTPKVQLYYSDGTAVNSGDLYVTTFDQLKNQI